VPQAEALINDAEKHVLKAVAEAEFARQRASKAEVERQRWLTLLTTLQHLSDGYDGASVEADANGEGAESSTVRVLNVMTAINGPTNTAEVAEHMPEVNRKTVSWALWKLADDDLIQRIGHGRYAPNGYQPDRPTTNYVKAGQLGMGVPPARPGTALLDAMARAKAGES
jgi:hypothetical protein